MSQGDDRHSWDVPQVKAGRVEIVDPYRWSVMSLFKVMAPKNNNKKPASVFAVTAALGERLLRRDAGRGSAMRKVTFGMALGSLPDLGKRSPPLCLRARTTTNRAGRLSGRVNGVHAPLRPTETYPPMGRDHSVAPKQRLRGPASTPKKCGTTPSKRVYRVQSRSEPRPQESWPEWPVPRKRKEQAEDWRTGAARRRLCVGQHGNYQRLGHVRPRHVPHGRAVATGVNQGARNGPAPRRSAYPAHGRVA